MNFVTFEDLNNCIYHNIRKIPRDIELVVGIPRSGTMVANLLALYLNLPYTDIDNFVSSGVLRSGTTRKCKNWIREISQAKKVLIVDDSISSGKAIKEVKDKIKTVGFSCECIYLAVYALRISCHLVDIYFELCEQPRMFEWNYMHHWALEFSCMDMDGVLCRDPSFLENDDGKKYRDFLRNADPLFLPTQKVGYIVTTRLEKYRTETEEWLAGHGIDYGKLIMLENISAMDRKLSFNQGAYKAEWYKKTNAVLFFESNYEQAVEISKISCKPVFCVDKRVLIQPDNIMGHLAALKNDFKITAKRSMKKILKKIQYVE